MLKKLKDECYIIMGQSPSSEFYNQSRDGIPFLQGRKTFGDKFPTIDTWTTKPSKIGNKNSVLMSVRAPVGDVNIAPFDVCIGRGLASIKMKNNNNNEYLYYLLKNNIGKIKNKSSGTVFDAINRSDLENLVLNFNDAIDQIKIEKILSVIDKKIELNNQINNNLQELINNTFIEYFVNYNVDNNNLECIETESGIIPINWYYGTLSDIVEFSNGYGFDSKKMLEKPEKDCYAVFKMGNINIGGGINKDKTKSWIKRKDCENIEKFIAKKGDILMCMTDMKNSGNPLLGHTALIDKDGEFVINQRVGILRCTKGISYEYVYTLSNLDFFINDLRSRANSGVQVNLTTSGICGTRLLIPSKDILKKFDLIAKPLYEKKFVLMQENETLENLRDTLLPKLMNGEIDLDNIEV